MIERLGNIYGEDKGTGYAGNVWDTDYCCPTINTCDGGETAYDCCYAWP